MDEGTIKVLCMFRYWARSEGAIAFFDDAIMIHVHSTDDILREFTEQVTRAIRNGWATGPVPRRWALTAYLPERPFPIFH